MTVARSVSDVLSEHVQFEVDCIDRMYLNVYVPQLQYAAGLVGYVHRRLGLPVASTAPLARITDQFSAAVRHFARDNAVPWVDFAKGQRKDDVMHEQLQRFTAVEGVVFIGRAQEKTNLFRTEKRRDSNGDSYPWIVKTTGLVNQFYFYCLDADFGPFFLKFCSYFPYNLPLQRQAVHQRQRVGQTPGGAGRIGFEPLDNGSPRSTIRRRCRRSATGWGRDGAQFGGQRAEIFVSPACAEMRSHALLAALPLFRLQVCAGSCAQWWFRSGVGPLRPWSR